MLQNEAFNHIKQNPLDTTQVGLFLYREIPQLGFKSTNFRL